MDNWSGGVQQLHPAPGTECNLRSHAVAFDAPAAFVKMIAGAIPS